MSYCKAWFPNELYIITKRCLCFVIFVCVFMFIIFIFNWLYSLLFPVCWDHRISHLEHRNCLSFTNLLKKYQYSTTMFSIGLLQPNYIFLLTFFVYDHPYAHLYFKFTNPLYFLLFSDSWESVNLSANWSIRIGFSLQIFSRNIDIQPRC